MNLDIFSQYPFLEATQKFFESLNILLYAYTDVPLTAKEALQKNTNRKITI